ncbi:MAG: hypothetical protein M3416_02840 [Acidobacteriota bacterium]|nr:hypothetical protein [Acidobacteriota bacterium]
MRMLASRLLLTSFAVALCAPTVAGQTHVGYVLEIEGTWHLNGDASYALKRWQKLRPGNSISAGSPTPGHRIVIASLNGGIIESRRCEVDDCSKPLRLGGGGQRRSLPRVIFDATVELLLGSPDRYSLHRNRSYGGALADGVVKLEKGEVDLGPVIRTEGRFAVRWRALPRSGEAGNWSSPVALRPERGGPALVAAADLRPGLYEVNLMRSMAGSYEPFASAWVVVSSAAQYESLATSFRQAVALTEQWGSTVETETSRRFLRAHLDHLAERGGR